jgi:NDP-sugar pyrophosphorylase family protein
VTTVSAELTGRQTLQHLMAHGSAQAVVRSTEEVLGTVTDTDLRRASMEGRLDHPVTSLLSAGDPPAGRPAIAVIMAGGRGQRLRPLTDKVPKPLLKVGRSSIVERIIASLVEAGVEEVALSVNYKAEVFRRRLGDGEHLGVALHYVHERHRMGTAGALSLLPRRPAGPILVTNGDIMTRLRFARLLEFHAACGGAATMGAVEHVTQVPYGVLRTEGVRLIGMDEKPELRVRVNAGFYVLEPELLDLLEAGKPLDMPELLQRATDAGLAVHVFPVLERWFDIGSPEDFQHVLMEFATGEEE